MHIRKTLIPSRSAFAKSRLVYLQKLKQWVFLSECVWNGPQQLKSTPRLNFEYPLCSSLFRDRLVLGNATLDHVVKELRNINENAPFDTLQQLLLLLNKYLTLRSPPGCLETLKGKKIIPVTKSGNEYHRDYDHDLWYFADRPSLWDRFNGKVPLISFDVKTVKELSPLIEAMKRSKYLLSAAVTQNLKIEGSKIKDEEKTADLRERARYLVR